MAGRAPFALHGELPGARDNYVHYVQDPFDIGSVVRPYVKWKDMLQSGYVAKEALRRAHSVMQSDPPGPVYMTLPREVLAEAVNDAGTGVSRSRLRPGVGRWGRSFRGRAHRRRAPGGRAPGRHHQLSRPQ